MIPFINANCINISRARKWFIPDDNAIEDFFIMLLQIPQGLCPFLVRTV